MSGNAGAGRMGGATGSLGGRLGAAPRLRAGLSSVPSIRVIDMPGAAPALPPARAGQAAGALERTHALPSVRSPFIETDATRGSLDALAAENARLLAELRALRADAELTSTGSAPTGSSPFSSAPALLSGPLPLRTAAPRARGSTPGDREALVRRGAASS